MRSHITVITLGVDDLERALTFYRDGLGLPTKGIVGKEFEHGSVAFFDLRHGMKLAIWPRNSISHDTGISRSPASPTDFTLDTRRKMRLIIHLSAIALLLLTTISYLHFSVFLLLLSAYAHSYWPLAFTVFVPLPLIVVIRRFWKRDWTNADLTLVIISILPGLLASSLSALDSNRSNLELTIPLILIYTTLLIFTLVLRFHKIESSTETQSRS